MFKSSRTIKNYSNNNSYIWPKNTLTDLNAVISIQFVFSTQSIGLVQPIYYIIMILLPEILVLWLTDFVTLSVQTLNILKMEDRMKGAFHYNRFNLWITKYYIFSLKIIVLPPRKSCYILNSSGTFELNLF